MAPALCNKLFKAECSDLIDIFLPSNPLRYPLDEALDTLFLRDANAGRLEKKCSLSSLPSSFASRLKVQNRAETSIVSFLGLLRC